MKIKISKYFSVYLLSIIFLVAVLFLTNPFHKLLNKVYLNNNEFVQGQVVINPQAKSDKIIDRKINIKFISEIDSELNWKFFSLTNSLEINVGENNIIKYEGKNVSNKTITATADFTVYPKKILPYIIKTECFCFTEQTLQPGESQTFSMVFFLDPALDSDGELDEIKDIVFTYRLSEYKS